MKILISGGSGFIGKNLVNHLIEKNYDIMLVGRNLDFINNSNTKKTVIDLSNPNFNYEEIINYNPNVFLHLAWEGLPDHSEEISKRNYYSSMRIIKTLIGSTNCSKIISTGSCWEYNDGNMIGECREDVKINPKTPFSIYKNKIFKEVFDITQKKNITFNWLRLFYVYGYGQKKTSIIPMLIDSIKNKKELNINYPSNINDYINVKDVSKIIESFISEDITSGIYNLGSGTGLEVKKLLRIIDLEINGNDNLTNEYLGNLDKNLTIHNFHASTKKLNKYLMNLELIDINTGIKNLIKHLKEE